MFNKISEGVVQGIFIAAIGFSAATVWKSFENSTNDLKTAKKQLDAQVIEKQSNEIKRLASIIGGLKLVTDELSKKASIKPKPELKDKLSEVENSLSERTEIGAAIQQQQYSQQQQQIQIQQQQVQQQQIQQEWR